MVTERMMAAESAGHSNLRSGVELQKNNFWFLSVSGGPYRFYDRYRSEGEPKRENPEGRINIKVQFVSHRADRTTFLQPFSRRRDVSL